MFEWMRRFLAQVRDLWGRWSLTQKLILVGVTGVAVVGLVVLVTLSAQPGLYPLLGVPVTDEALRSRIVTRLDEENVRYTVNAEGMVMVEDEATARRLRSILIREDLLPADTDPWALFDIERWTITEFERNVNLRRAITRQLEQHIEAIEGIDNASVNLVMPEARLFAEEQQPVSASVILVPTPGANIEGNRAMIEGIEKLIQFAVEGLIPENIVITNHRGVVLNDFEGMEDFDRIELTRREIKTVRDVEAEYAQRIIRSLQQIYGADRVELVNLDVVMDLSKRTVQTEEHFPIVLKPDNPRTPFDDSEVTESVTISRSALDEEFVGSGFSPEGPPGQEGQIPPAYQDLEGQVGRYSRNTLTENEVVNTRNIYEERSPWSIDRVSVGVALDGIWRKLYNEQGELVLNPDGSIAREYIPVPPEELAKAEALVERAIGYNPIRGDQVSIQHVQFNRTAQFMDEDAEYRRKLQTPADASSTR